MAVLITLEDGQELYISNLAADGMLWLISEQVSNDHLKLRRWVADVSKRPAPYIDFDVRGFSPADRVEFYAAAQLALDKLLRADPNALEKGGSIEALATLMGMKQGMDRVHPSALSNPAEVRSFYGEPIDLSQIWFEDETAEEGPGS
jgi:hypothetical protein